MQPPPASSKRPILLAVAVGVAISLAAIAIVISIIAVPLFALARFTEQSRALDRPIVRDGLLRVALPAGVVLGTLSGVLVFRWYRHGGHLPREWE